MAIIPKKPRPRGARKFGRITSSHGSDNGGSKGTAELPSVTHGYFKSFDGTKLFYSVEGTGKPLVFCYGLVCSSLHWTYQIDHFRRKYKAVWFDYRGHQNSEVPKDLHSLTIENIACDLGYLLDELGIKDAVFLGHSMGVNVVLEFYRQQPERVAGMILANGTAKSPLETMFHNNLGQKGFGMLKKLYDFSPGIMRTIWDIQGRNPLGKSLVSLAGFNPHLTPQEDIDLYVKTVTEMDPGILLHLVENYDSYDATAWLHTVKAPTLIIGGEQDHMIPKEQQELMHQLIPNSRLEIVRHGSHCTQMDLPELVNMKIERWLRDMGYAPAELTSPEAASQEAAENECDDGSNEARDKAGTSVSTGA